MRVEWIDLRAGWGLSLNARIESRHWERIQRLRRALAWADAAARAEAPVEVPGYAVKAVRRVQLVDIDLHEGGRLDPSQTDTHREQILAVRAIQPADVDGAQDRATGSHEVGHLEPGACLKLVIDRTHDGELFGQRSPLRAWVLVCEAEVRAQLSAGVEGALFRHPTAEQHVVADAEAVRPVHADARGRPADDLAADDRGQRELVRRVGRRVVVE